METTQSRFEIMFDAINAHDSRKVADIVNMLAAKGIKRTKEEEQIFFVAKCVLDDKLADGKTNK